MNARKNLLCFFLVTVLLTASHAEAQQSVKIRKIGVLNTARIFPASFDAFRQGMRELGYVEGRNLVIEYRSGDQAAKMTESANELVQHKVEVIVALGPTARSAKAATDTIPIVFNYSGD